MTLCLRLGFLRSPRLETRLLIRCLYLLPVSLNSVNTRNQPGQGKIQNIQRCTIVYRDILEYTVIYYGILEYTVIYYGTLEYTEIY